MYLQFRNEQSIHPNHLGVKKINKKGSFNKGGTKQFGGKKIFQLLMKYYFKLIFQLRIFVLNSFE